METAILYPQLVDQSVGGGQRKWKNLSYITNGGTDKAEPELPINPKGFTYSDPSKISVTNFKFSIPNDARIRQIVVEYRHRKVGVCETPSHVKYSCESNKTTVNIGGPTITLLQDMYYNHNGALVGTAITSGKGSAPTGNSTHFSNTFNVDLPASVVNGNRFGLSFDYPANTNKNYGYIRLRYIRVKLVYVTPNYGVSIEKVEGGYNQEPYKLKVTASNLNNTPGSPGVTLTAPQGFSFVKYSGDGTLTPGQVRTWIWTPVLGTGKGSSSVELEFLPSVIYSQGASSYSGNFDVAIGQYANATHVATIVERPVTANESEEVPPSFVDDTSVTDISTKKVTIGDEFEYTLSIDEITWNNVLHSIYKAGVDADEYTGTFEEEYNNIVQKYVYFCGAENPEDRPEDFSENEHVQYKENNSWSSSRLGFKLSELEEMGKEVTLTLKGVSQGGDTVYASVYVLIPGLHHIVLGTWKFLIRPTEQSLTDPYYTKMNLSDEEFDRLGDGYGYTVQTNLKEITTDTYVRDWYKNFRIGVFNNRIEANCTDYTNWDTDGTVQNRDIEYYTGDLTGCTLVLSVDYPLTVEISETTYNLTSSSSATLSNLTSYIQSAKLTRVSNDNVKLTVTLKDSNNNTLQTIRYKVNFNEDAELEPYPSTDDTTDYDNLTDSEIIENAEYWGDCVTDVNVYQSITCPFTYDEDYPLHILIVGDYSEATTMATIKFTEPCIIETAEYTSELPNGNFPVEIEAVIGTTDSAELTLEAYETNNQIVLYKLPLMEHYGTNNEIAVRGIELQGNIEQADNLVLNATLKAPTGARGNRSLIINEYRTSTNNDTSFKIGGNGDLWGFRTLDMVEMEDWELLLSYSNNLSETQSNINFNDVRLIFYIEPVETTGIQIKIEDEDTRYYGAFLRDLDIPFGLKTDTDYLTIDGTDTNDAYRQNIREKTITLTFDVGECGDIEANTQTLRQLTKLIVNEKDKYNRPIPKRIWFSHLPDLYAEYICEDVFDTEIDINTYTIKAKIIIPAGCFYTLDSTQTNTIGYVQGVAGIFPNISIKPTAQNIVILESNSQQKFTINLPTIDTPDTSFIEQPTYNTGIIEIDCENQICWFKENEDDTYPININKYVNYESDWFILKNEYSFETGGCILRIVDYEERW